VVGCKCISQILVQSSEVQKSLLEGHMIFFGGFAGSEGCFDQMGES